MFNSELYEISEKAFESINYEYVQRRYQKLEKDVLKMIKKYAYKIDENGISRVRVLSRCFKGPSAYSMRYSAPNAEYEVLKRIMDLGRQKYFEEEYSLYIVDTEHVELDDDRCDAITFIWNSMEYNIRNMPEAKRTMTLKN